MRILIVGALGDIGTEATRRAVASGHAVIGLDTKPREQVTSIDLTNPSIDYIQADATDFEAVFDAMRTSACDGVITLAAIRNPSDYLVASHNVNVVISWNVLRAAAELGITRVAQASSVNVVGAIFNEKVEVDYIPMDENHPCRPDEPYGLSKQIMELQGEAIVRRFPFMRVASIRTHWAIPASDWYRTVAMDEYDSAKQLWGWTEIGACARAFLLALTASLPTFQSGHEAFFVISPKLGSDKGAVELIDKWWPNAKRMRAIKNTDALFDCSKAERMLGWIHDLDEDTPIVPKPMMNGHSVIVNGTNGQVNGKVHAKLNGHVETHSVEVEI